MPWKMLQLYVILPGLIRQYFAVTNKLLNPGDT